MKVKANFKFKDLQENKIRMKGMAFEVSEERAKYLMEKTFNGVPYVSAVQSDPKPSKQEATKQEKEAKKKATTKEDKAATKRETK